MARKQPVKVSDFRIEGKRIVIKDTKRRLWERHDDMPIGTWGTIVLPVEPEDRPRRPAKGGK